MVLSGAERRFGIARDSDGLLWSVKPTNTNTHKTGVLQTIHNSTYCQCLFAENDAVYLVKWRLDSCTSISLLLKSLSSFLIAACRGQKRRRIERSCKRLSAQTAASKAPTLPPFGMPHALFTLFSGPWIVLLSSPFISIQFPLEISNNTTCNMLLVYLNRQLVPLTVMKCWHHRFAQIKTHLEDRQKWQF